MAPPTEKLATTTRHEEAEEAEETEFEVHHVALREGRQLVLGEEDGKQLVEIRAEDGQLEVRIQLTDAGPVLQMEAVRMQLRASESVAIEAKQVSVTASEALALSSKTIQIESQEDLQIRAGHDLRMVGTMIYLN